MSRRVLFFAEAVSLAHVVRPVVLAGRLSALGDTVHLACADRYAAVTRDPGWVLHPVHGPEPDVFMARLAAGAPVFTQAELSAAIEEDQALITQVQPDLVVGDFRLSLSISARRCGVPYLAIANAHWSPMRAALPGRMPDHPLGALFGYRMLDPLFQRMWPVFAARHLSAPNRLRRTFGMTALASLEHWYCDADAVAFADLPGLVPCSTKLPVSSRYIGPVVWSPTMPDPAWWHQVQRTDQPFAYITMGSTGDVDLLPRLVQACRAAGASCLVSTAARTTLAAPSPDVFCQDFLPGFAACARASVVVCNGGSATVHQALSQGRPVLGICSNLDQVRTMQHVEAGGAGLWIRSNEAEQGRVRDMVRRLMMDASFSAAAGRHQADMRLLWAQQPFETLVAQTLAVHQSLATA